MIVQKYLRMCVHIKLCPVSSCCTTIMTYYEHAGEGDDHGRSVQSTCAKENISTHEASTNMPTSERTRYVIFLLIYGC